jgi:hypothetical protein
MSRRHRPPPPTSLYQALNRTHWGGRLPVYRVRRDRQVVRSECAWGLCDHRKRLIRLAPELVGDRLREVLLHEMVHVRVPDEDHGPRFRRELARLVRRGEPALQRHLDQLDQQEVWDAALVADLRQNPEELCREIQGELERQAQEAPRRQWRTVYRALRELPDWPHWLAAWAHHWPGTSCIAWMQDVWRAVSAPRARAGTGITAPMPPPRPRPTSRPASRHSAR